MSVTPPRSQIFSPTRAVVGDKGTAPPATPRPATAPKTGDTRALHRPVTTDPRSRNRDNIFQNSPFKNIVYAGGLTQLALMLADYPGTNEAVARKLKFENFYNLENEVKTKILADSVTKLKKKLLEEFQNPINLIKNELDVDLRAVNIRTESSEANKEKFENLFKQSIKKHNISGYLSKSFVPLVISHAHAFKILNPQAPLTHFQGDYSNIGGTNTHFKNLLSQSNPNLQDEKLEKEAKALTDRVARLVAAVIKQKLLEGLDLDDSKTVFIGLGGDEIGGFVPAEVADVNKIFKETINPLLKDITRTLGLDQHPHGKYPEDEKKNGFGIGLGAADFKIETYKDLGRISDEIEGQIKANKKNEDNKEVPLSTHKVAFREFMYQLKKYESQYDINDDAEINASNLNLKQVLDSTKNGVNYVFSKLKHLQAYIDPATHCYSAYDSPNFADAINKALKEREGPNPDPHVLTLEFGGLGAFNKYLTQKGGDVILNKLARIVKNTKKEHGFIDPSNDPFDKQVTSIGGGKFEVFFPSFSRDKSKQLREFAEAIRKKINDLNEMTLSDFFKKQNKFHKKKNHPELLFETKSIDIEGLKKLIKVQQRLKLLSMGEIILGPKGPLEKIRIVDLMSDINNQGRIREVKQGATTYSSVSGIQFKPRGKIAEEYFPAEKP